jgi:zinc/manganese transport system substrate-binding protein
MTARTSAAIVAVAFAAIGLTACGGGATPGGTQGGAGGKITAVASTDVWGSVLSAVGGDQVEVTSILHDPAADPHSYEATPPDVIAVTKAQLALGNGGGYDDFFSKLADQAPGARKLFAYDIARDAGAADDNEHVWYSFTAVEKVADQVAGQLGQIRPEAAQTFTANANAFKSRVEALAADAARIGGAHPGTKVLVTEPVPHYLIETAKLTDATPEAFSAAVENETDVPAAALAEVNGLISGKQVKAVLNNDQTVTPSTSQVVEEARKAGIPVVGVTETLPTGVVDYIAWMTGQVNALAGAFGS